MLGINLTELKNKAIEALLTYKDVDYIPLNMSYLIDTCKVNKEDIDIKVSMFESDKDQYEFSLTNGEEEIVWHLLASVEEYQKDPIKYLIEEFNMELYVLCYMNKKERALDQIYKELDRVLTNYFCISMSFDINIKSENNKVKIFDKDKMIFEI